MYIMLRKSTWAYFFSMQIPPGMPPGSQVDLGKRKAKIINYQGHISSAALLPSHGDQIPPFDPLQHLSLQTIQMVWK